MNYIIFGGSGFIGTHLIHLLKELHPDSNIYDLDIVMPGEEGVVPGIVEKNKGVKYIRCDVRKPIDVEIETTKDDVVFNLAAVHRTPGHEDIEYFETNIRGAENVTAWVECKGIKKMIFTSSIAPYGAAEALKKETTLPTPNTPYGISKLVAEKIHETWKEKNQGQLIIVRPGIVYGKGEHALYPEHEVYTIGIINPKTNIAPHTKNNYYVNCPDRPGIGKGTFNLKVLFEIKNIIDANNIDIIYFESQHIWNMFIMLLCPFKRTVVAVHDVIPHDGNKAMTLANYVTCHLSNGVILRNYMYKNTLSQKYKIKSEKITCFELWRDYPEKVEPSYSNQFLYFGRIRKYKGFELFAKIIEKTPHIKYRIVGEADEESKYLVDYVRNFENVSLVEYEVSDSQMIEEFKCADWVVLPYSNATQSGVITDACRYARPVISFNVGAIKEQIEDGKTGFLIKAGDIDGFANKVNEVNKFSRDKLREFSENAYSFGYKKYAAKFFADKFFALMQRI